MEAVAAKNGAEAVLARLAKTVASSERTESRRIRAPIISQHHVDGTETILAAYRGELEHKVWCTKCGAKS